MALKRETVMARLAALYEDFYRTWSNDPLLSLTPRQREVRIVTLDDNIKVTQAVLADIDRVAEHGTEACQHSSVRNRGLHGSQCDICDYIFPDVFSAPKV